MNTKIYRHGYKSSKVMHPYQLHRIKQPRFKAALFCADNKIIGGLLSMVIGISFSIAPFWSIKKERCGILWHMHYTGTSR